MPNRLAGTTSPYLLQHADNPVDWRPWGADALAEAQARNRPILLSVGYAACHWCHVMAHESFENDETAALMNELFVNIKVDREERPDIDAIYMQALHMLGEQGGWPLTMFLTPDGRPFWGGTYFPPEGRWGRPGFRDVLITIDRYWRDQPDAVKQNVSALGEAMKRLERSHAGGAIALDDIERATLRLAEMFDAANGGIGTAPKFPSPSILALMLATAVRTARAALAAPVLLTLERMSQGGIYDHLGGGYARYATDAAWLVPHFEKMLYDNAQLVQLLARAWQLTGNPLFEARVRETVAWVLREMVADGGGFAATLDADSEGEEGKFYVWSKAEVERALGADAPLFCAVYDVAAGGNWEGHNILNRTGRPGPLANDEEATLARCRDKLLAARGHRVRPGWDDKVLADWNGLMIAALAEAGAVFGEPGWIAAAERAHGFVRERMGGAAAGGDGRLLHGWRDGRPGPAAMLDDYASMALAALALHEATGEAAYLADARRWMETLDAQFRDTDGGGYFFTAADAEALIVRAKSAHDNATPSGNGMAAETLARLWLLTGEDDLRARAEETIAAFSGEMAQNFFPLAALMLAADTLQNATRIVIVGTRGEADTDALLAAVRRACVPARVLSAIAPGADLPAAHPAHGKGRADGRATAYVCVGQSCSLPLTDPAALSLALRPAVAPAPG
jgi:hypothetical protein